ncbi:hypothetical protein SprV_0200618000 [Sparganum proliferum]
MFSYILVATLALTFVPKLYADAVCVKENGICSGTVFQQCCGDLMCELEGIGRGKPITMFYCIVVVALALAFTPNLYAETVCMKENEVCSGTAFQRCCGDLMCELEGFGRGKCVRPRAWLPSHPRFSADAAVVVGGGITG